VVVVAAAAVDVGVDSVAAVTVVDAMDQDQVRAMVFVHLLPLMLVSCCNSLEALCVF
jgi:hypothetical protein